MEDIKRTALYEAHKKLNGKIIDFSNWALPVQYQGIIEEHEAVRNAAGIFDVSHMGQILIEGKEAPRFIQWLITNDISALEDYKIIYSPMCYENGGIVDDVVIYKYNNEKFLMVVNASNTEKDFDWVMQQSKNFDVVLENISDGISQIALQGPKSQEILQKLTNTDLSTIKFFHFNPEVKIAGVTSIVSRTGYTGEDGFEIYCKNKDIEKIWESILEVGQEFGIKPAGLGARDTLRFEASLALYGNEINQDITPLEAGLGFFVKMNKNDFIGKEALEKQKAEGLKRKLVGIEVKKGIPRTGYPVLKDEKQIGAVTSGYQSPTLKKNIALAIIDADYSEIGEKIDIQIRKKIVPGEVINKQFYKKNTK